MKYEIIESDDRSKLNLMVNRNLDAGWTISGGVAVNDGRFCQVICHKSDGDPKPYTGSSEEDAQLASCGICGKADCDNPLHSTLEDIASAMKGLKDIKK